MKPATLLLFAVVIALSACGVRRPLIRPEDVPAYEARRAKRLQQLKDDNDPYNPVTTQTAPVNEATQPGAVISETPAGNMPNATTIPSSAVTPQAQPSPQDTGAGGGIGSLP